MGSENGQGMLNPFYSGSSVAVAAEYGVRLRDSENGFTIIETLIAQRTSTVTNNTSWYYTDDSSDIFTLSNKNYGENVHIGKSLLIVLPTLVFEDGSNEQIMLLRTFSIPPGKPIIQIAQNIIKSCENCDEDEDGAEQSSYDWPQIFQKIFDVLPDMNLNSSIPSLTEHVKMLSNVPAFDRHYYNSSHVVDIEEIIECETSTTEVTTVGKSTNPDTSTVTFSTSEITKTDTIPYTSTVALSTSEIGFTDTHTTAISNILSTDLHTAYNISNTSTSFYTLPISQTQPISPTSVPSSNLPISSTTTSSSNEMSTDSSAFATIPQPGKDKDIIIQIDEDIVHDYNGKYGINKHQGLKIENEFDEEELDKALAR
ncbi:hypothetical protein SK128_015550 [Halocaridina rubra]|uniref:Uncharacterized protein n=1 Tax=Halocaridina rubra TaxID=373956 RepID=A0AAN9A5N2_HALRR